MFFEQEYVVFELLEVIFLDQQNVNVHNSNRNFDALSFRYEADTILSAGKQQLEAHNNSICYIPSNISYTRQSSMDKMIVIHFKTFNYHSEKIEYFNPGNPDKYQKLFSKISDCWNKKELSYKNECASLLSKILSELYKDNQHICQNKKISESILYIEKNFLKKDFSLKDAVAKSFISETYFRKLFKNEYHISPKQYIINRRIEHAKALIIAGYFSISEIAHQCGYNDEKHFSSEFKKITGVSPSKYNYNYH